MKKTFSKKSTIVIIAAVVALVAVIAAYVFIPVKVKDISGIDEDRQIVYLGETLEPEYTVEPAKLKDKKYEIKFYRSDPEVANVDDKGCITANKLGETVLTLKVLNYEEEVTIVVVPNVTEITNISNTIELVEGDCKTIKPKLVFAEKRFSGEKVKYLIEDKNIASINSKGTIKAINPGITKLTITAGGREKTVKIIINEYIPPEPETQSSYIYYDQHKKKSYTYYKSYTQENSQATEGEGSFDLSSEE